MARDVGSRRENDSRRVLSFIILPEVFTRWFFLATLRFFAKICVKRECDGSFGCPQNTISTAKTYSTFVENSNFPTNKFACTCANESK